MKKAILILFVSLSFVISSFAQNEDPVLFTVDEKPVNLSEFLYIYQKNNGKKADFSENSLKEYLDLYTKFKLKVTKARDMQLDTIPELIKELAGYRKQLSKSYLVDKQVNDKLIREVFDRRKKDLNVSHILILNKNEADIEKTSLANAKIHYLHNQLVKGASFADLAEEHSEDKSSAMQGGNLGFVTSMLPEGFYEFENEIYKLKVGEFSEPFKTEFGYHIVKVDDERPARGKIEAAHIMIRKKDKGKLLKNSRVLIDSLYNNLIAGESFEELAKQHSMDKKTNKKGGYLGVFGINRYESDFEDAAFQLKKDSDITKPASSSVGWHIIKRISKPASNNYDKAKRSIGSEISNVGRFDIAKKALIENIKLEAGYTVNSEVLKNFSSSLDPGFFTLYWNTPDSIEMEIFKLGDRSYTLKKFADYCKKNQRERIRYGKTSSLKLAVNELFKKYTEESCLLFEEENLEAKYPDFKSLMREYDEGILLFEATKREVWDKASQDTSGLKKFYKGNKDNYLWKPRADVYAYTIHSNDEKLLKKIYKSARKKDHQNLLDKFNNENQIITFSRDKVEMGSRDIKGMEWKKNALSKIEKDNNGVSKFRKIEEILPKNTKSLNEARGYVIADYQEFLEKNWVDSLRKEYKVKLNEKVFEDLIK